jgi:putative transposase
VVVSVAGYRSCRRPDQHGSAWRKSPQNVTTKHPRRGFRPAYHDARAEGWIVNHKRIQRLWREEGLRVPQRRRRKRHGTSTAPDTVIADGPNRVWAVDFQFDVTTDGRPIKIVPIVDEHTRECLGGLVRRSITGEQLIAELDRLAAERGTYPTVLRCDNGPELACAAMADWAHGTESQSPRDGGGGTRALVRSHSNSARLSSMTRRTLRSGLSPRRPRPPRWPELRELS